MPLKPGQKKELNVEITKLKGLEELELKISNLKGAMGGLTQAKGYYGALSKDISVLEKKIQAEMTATNQKIQALKATQPKADEALDKLVKTIAKECSQVVSVYRKTKLVLMRGLSDTSAKAFVGRSWNKREPKDSDAEAQALYDKILAKSGFKALRSNSIFTTTAMWQASEYGELYYIFPKNGFAYHWNKHNQDLVLESLGDLLDIEKFERVTLDVENWYYKTYKKELNWKYEDPYEALYDFKGFQKKVIALKYPKAKDIQIEKFIDMDVIKNDIGPTQTNFDKGLKSGNEMVIAGEYYAVQAESKIGEQVLKALKIEAQNNPL